MTDRPVPRFFYDYVDPASYLMDRLLERVLGETGREGTLGSHPFEIQPPPRPMLDPEDPDWREYWDEMLLAAEALAVEMQRPLRTPWSRKAHELALLARTEGVFPVVHQALFRAYAVEGRDIGRIDVLVEIGGAAGLDPSRTKAALDVDRHSAELLEHREDAERLGVRGVPTLLVRGRLVEGLQKPEDVRSLLFPG